MVSKRANFVHSHRYCRGIRRIIRSRKNRFIRLNIRGQHKIFYSGIRAEQHIIKYTAVNGCGHIFHFLWGNLCGLIRFRDGLLGGIAICLISHRIHAVYVSHILVSGCGRYEYRHSDYNCKHSRDQCRK